MAELTNYIMAFCGVLIILFCFFPLILKFSVNKKIEKRYKCKLNVEIENRKIFPLYSYFKNAYPAATIAMAYIFNSNKSIEKYPGLKEINYNIKTAPKFEIFICCVAWINGVLIALCIVFYLLATKIFGINP